MNGVLLEDNAAIATRLIRQWIEQCVIDLLLCPFASAPYRADRVRIVVCESESAADYLAQTEAELERLAGAPETETTLIAATAALADFLDFNDFLAEVEDLLVKDVRQQHFQLASFHPQYRFAGVDADDVGNFTNRAPYPVVQWLRAETIEKAVESTDTLAIPDNNISKLDRLGRDGIRKLFPWA